MSDEERNGRDDGTRGATTPAVIVVAGVDPGGGAGIAADVAALAALGVRAAPVASALTVQTDRGVARVEPVGDELFALQLEAALESVGDAARAVKTGLVVSRRHAELVAAAARGRGLALIVDPILASGTGHRFVAGDPAEILRPLLDAATMVTPNAAEAAALCGTTWAARPDQLPELARTLATDRRTAVVTAGDLRALDGQGAETVLMAAAGPADDGTGALRERRAEAPRVERGKTHGTGCAFASTCAGLIARGSSPLDAAVEAHRRVARALALAGGLPGRRLSPEMWRVR